MLTVAAAASTVAAASAVAVRFVHRDDLPEFPADKKPKVLSEWRTLADGGARLGDPRARVTLVVFSDYLCQYCRAAAEDLHALLGRHPRDVAVVWRQYPVLGAQSAPAAVAAECSRLSGWFEPVHDRLFAQNDSFGLTSWTRIAAEAGLPDTAKFADCLSDTVAAAAVNEDVNVGRQLGIAGTPTIVLDSLMFLGLPDAVYLDRYVRLAIAGKE